MNRHLPQRMSPLPVGSDGERVPVGRERGRRVRGYLAAMLAAAWYAVPMCAGSGAPDWESGDGFRRAAVAIEPGGRGGFTRLPSGRTGLEFTNRLSDEMAARNQIRLNGSGVAAGDIDGDGRCDLYFCRLEGPNALYRNQGDWQFEEITATAGVGCPDQFSTGAVFADIDGDRDLDLLVNSIGGGTRLFLNDGKGRFTEASAAGLERKYGSTSLALGDIDGDGDLDLYVANYRTTTVRSTGMNFLIVDGKRTFLPQDRDSYEFTPEGRLLEHGEPDFLYLNDGGGRWTAVPWTGGRFLDEAAIPLKLAPRDWGLSVMFRDLTGDGAPEIYVCNDFHSPDRLWINDGKGRFRAADRLALRNTSTFSMAMDVADLNRDGRDDLIVVDMLDRDRRRRMMQMAAIDPSPSPIGKIDDRPQYDRNTVQLNRGDGTFAEIAHYAGLEASDWSWAVVCLDVDLDGFEDVLMTTGHLFDTQDLDADARINAAGPFPKERVHTKLLMYPRLQMEKVAFRNRGDLTFEEIGARWGFDDRGVAHGMALADLDNDGDLDVIVNQLNLPAACYRNDSVASRLAVRLKGRLPNSQGVGARIGVTGGPVPQSQEIICGGRYLSGDEPLRVFAAGTARALTIEVFWRSGRRSRVENARPNSIYEIDESTATEGPHDPGLAVPGPLFEEASHLLTHTHVEQPFDDFQRQPLLPNRLSQLGPGVAWFDLNQDGWDDLIVGSGRGGRLAVFLADGTGGFRRESQPPYNSPVTRDQTSVLGWHRAAGSAAVLVGSANFEDGLTNGSPVRIYDPARQKVEDPLAGDEASVGPLALADIDLDGDLDLFVGGRTFPGRYPVPVSSRLFRNDAGQFVFESGWSRVFRGVGQVSGAVFSDLDSDGRSDLVLACEWGPVRIFWNGPGGFREAPEALGLAKWTGWWNGVTTGDFDGDGRLDIVASNWGLNTKYRAEPQAPRIVFFGDIDRNGTEDVIEAFFERGTQRLFPERDLLSMAAAMPWLRGRFPTHEAFARADVAQLFGDQLSQARRLEATALTSMLFLNRGDRFEGIPLPIEAQLSPAFAAVVADFDGDGSEDLFLSQNFFATQPQTSRNDAGRGLVLLGDGRGGLRSLSGQASGVRVYGEQRGAAAGDYDADGRTDLVVAQNGAETKLYRNRLGKPGVRVRLRGGADNPHGVGAVIRLVYGERKGPVREVRAGSGYWSQDSAVQVMGFSEPPKAVWVRWPGGREQTRPLPLGTGEIILNRDGPP